MGFNSSATSVTLTAKLTPLGRQLLVSNINTPPLIANFILGDSDANYSVVNSLTTGQVPAESGNVGPNDTISNSTTENVVIRSFLIANGNGIISKSVEPSSMNVVANIIANGQVTISGTNITTNIINRSDFATDSLVNLFYSFGLPLNSRQDETVTGVTSANGGFADTALSGLAQSKILVFGINNNSYGESLDGKEIKLDVVTTAGTYSVYSTFQNTGSNLKVQDANFRDKSIVTANIGSNIAFLFSDNIMTPNGGSPSLSWGTGFGSVKPFSVNGKQLYNLQTNSSVGVSADTIVGIAYLDKGFLVITDPTIVSNFGTTGITGTSIVFNSISTSISQNITCIADRGTFGSSTNPTFGPGDTPRFSEIALLDNVGNIIAYGKTDRQIPKGINEFLALAVNIFF